MITHVFDPSAILAHYFQEPGAEQVNALLADNSVEVGLPATALIDLKLRLASTVPDPAEARRAYRLYAEELIAALPVTREVVADAERILERLGNEFPLSAAFVAATARQQGAVLVHRDAHLALLPGDLVQQFALPLET
ncbi:MAG: PIN domain-containing protein [Opitutaceae bacterium]